MKKFGVLPGLVLMCFLFFTTTTYAWEKVKTVDMPGSMNDRGPIFNEDHSLVAIKLYNDLVVYDNRPIYPAFQKVLLSVPVGSAYGGIRVVFNSDKTLVSILSIFEASLWDLTTGKKIYSYNNPNNYLPYGVFLADKKHFLFANQIDPSVLVDISTGKKVLTYPSAWATSPDGSKISIGYTNGNFVPGIYDTVSGKLLNSEWVVNGWLTDEIAWDRSQSETEYTISIVNPVSGDLKFKLSFDKKNYPHDLQLDSSGTRLLLATDSGNVLYMYDMTTGSLLWKISENDDRYGYGYFTFSPDGQEIMAYYSENVMGSEKPRRWVTLAPKNGQQTSELPFRGLPSYLGDSKHIWTYGVEGSVRKITYWKW